MKKIILLVFLFVMGGQKMLSQQYQFVTSGVSMSVKDAKNNWLPYTDFKEASIMIHLDTQKNRWSIYSEIIQLYTILNYIDEVKTENGTVWSFDCIDNDGNKAVLSVITNKKEGNRKQLYIYSEDRILVYNISIKK